MVLSEANEPKFETSCLSAPNLKNPNTSTKALIWVKDFLSIHPIMLPAFYFIFCSHFSSYMQVFIL